MLIQSIQAGFKIRRIFFGAERFLKNNFFSRKFAQKASQRLRIAPEPQARCLGIRSESKKLRGAMERSMNK